MISEGCEPDVYTYQNMIYPRLISEGFHVQEAIKWFVKMTEAGIPPSVVTYHKVISQLCKAGYIPEGMQW